MTMNAGQPPYRIELNQQKYHSTKDAENSMDGTCEQQGK